MKIRGNTIVTPVPKPDWNQTDPTKADYIKNKPDLSNIGTQDVVNAWYDIYENRYNGNFAELRIAFQSGKTVMLSANDPVGGKVSYYCVVYTPADFGGYGQDELHFCAVGYAYIETMILLEDGTIHNNYNNLYGMKTDIDNMKNDMGDIESALDSIIAIQNSLIGGE